MRRAKQVLVGLAALTVFISVGADSARSAKKKAGWPRQFKGDDGSSLVIHQPQIDRWKDYLTLHGRAAAEITPKGQSAPTYAAVRFAMQTVSNVQERKVTLYNIEVTKADYSVGKGQEPSAAVKQTLTRLFPGGPMQISLDRLLPYLKKPQTKVKKKQLSFKVPKIYVSDRPAVLVLLDGKPAMEKVGSSDVMHVVNTTWDLFYEVETGRYYLRNGAYWLQTNELTKGPWAPAASLPRGLYALPKVARFKQTRANLPGKRISTAKMPRVFVDQGAAALIATEGKPKFSPIPKTKILYLVNSKSDVFLHSDGRLYLLMGGRWLRARSLKGPWKALPKGPPREFAKIPPNHAKAGALTAVAGTRQATEAVIVAQIPQQASVKKGTTIAVSYVGDPVFKPVPGTTMYYAVNTSFDVLKVGSTYYACVNGVWFVSTFPKGPFKVAQKVDKVVYTIPPSSPKHHVTYVYVYETTPDTVVVGYTAAYMGLFVWSGMVIWGTGYHYHYPPYYHAHYHHHYAYHHGAYHGGHHYGHATYGHGVRYNPRMGGFERRSYAAGTINGRPVHGTRARGGNAYSSWGKSTVVGRDRAVQTGHYSSGRGTAAGFRSTTGAKGVAYSGRHGSGAVVKGRHGPVYAGRDNGVYRKTNDGWQKADVARQGSGQRQRSADKINARTRSDLDRDHVARQQGEARSKWQSQQSRGESSGRGKGGQGQRSRGSFGAGRSGGGRFGGGGLRGRR